MTAGIPKRPLERSEIDREAVLAQLERIVEHPAFRGSVRSARFLRYVVEHWLEEEHHGELLKERTLGVALFGLNPGYDTAQTTIVRNTAVDVRKRLYMYYHESDRAGEIQIALPVGSYIPQIYLAEQKSQEAETAAAEFQVEHAEQNDSYPDATSLVPPVTPKLPDRRWVVFLSLTVLVAVAAGALGGIMIGRHRSAQSVSNQGDLRILNLFWQPVLAATPPDPVILVCVGQMPEAVSGQQVTPIGNAFAIAAIIQLLDLEGAKFRIGVANSVTQEQMRLSTVILIGGIDNPLTLYEQNSMRFRIATAPGSNGTVWIEDRDHPEKREWSLSPPSPNSEALADYAILARFKDPGTGQWRVFAGGLDGVGTDSASEILAVPNSMQEVTKQLPAGWTSKNVEMVIKVSLVNGRPGYAQLVAYDIR